MREHSVYPLQDTLINDAILSTIYPEPITETVSLYIDAKGNHLIWQQVKTNKDGETIWNDGSILMETVSEDITTELAAKLDYDGAAPDFDNKTETNNDDPWFVTSPEAKEDYMFTLCGIKNNEGTHVTHVFTTDGNHVQLLLAPGSEAKAASLEHSVTALAINHVPSDAITRLETDADILSKAKELMK